MSTRIEKQEEGKFLISGLLEFATATQLARQGNELFKIEGDALVLDLGGVTRSDSAGLALLIEWRRVAEQRKQTLSFSNIPQQLLDIAEVSGIDKLISTWAAQRIRDRKNI